MMSDVEVMTPIYDDLCFEFEDPLDPTWDVEWFR